MADTASLANAMYPNLPSEAEAAPPVRPEAGSAPSLAEKMYGTTPADGLEKARAGIAAGIARPAAEPASPPTEREPASDWLADAARDQQPEAEAAAPVEVAAPSHLVDRFNDMAAGLGTDGREKLMKLHQEALAETSTRYWNEQGAAWEKQSRAQFGSRLPSMVGAVQPLLNDPRLTPPAFRELLNQYRIGSHPVVIDTLARWARQMRRGR